MMLVTESDGFFAAYRYHLAMDPNPNVRRAVLTNIAITYQTLPDILERTRDVRDIVRCQVSHHHYHKFCRKLELLQNHCVWTAHLLLLNRLSFLQNHYYIILVYTVLYFPL